MFPGVGNYGKGKYIGKGFPGGSVVKTHLPVQETQDTGSIPESGRSLGEGNSNPLQYSCLGHPVGREAWWATVHKVAKSRTQSACAQTHT